MTMAIRNHLNEHFPIRVTNLMMRDLEMFRISYETRDENPNALNSPLLGVFPMYFTDKDQKDFFQIFHVDKNELKRVIDKIPTINSSFKVISDPFNILTTWLIHLSYDPSLKQTTAEQFRLSLLKLNHYKFFTSLVNHRFPHGANEAIMQATIDGLTNKFDIIEHGTWGSVMEERSKDVLVGVHEQTLKKYDDDKAILYVISDMQTRIRNKIQIIVSRYYTTKESGDKIKSHVLAKEVDGEKIISNPGSVFDAMIANLSSNMLNTNMFVDHQIVKLVSGLFTNISPEALRQVLYQFSSLAILQAKSKQLDRVKKTNNGELYIGTRILISKIIQKTYRSCINSSDVNMKNPVSILLKTKNLYSSSRILDPDILAIKSSVGALVDQFVRTTRNADKASMRIAFIVYVMVQSFSYL